MKLVKLFEFDELPDFVGDNIFILAINLMGDSPLDYGAFKYTIGEYETEYENATKKNRKEYPISEVEHSRMITMWFIEHGCEKGETILIHR